MIRIDSLRMHLPNGFQHRAATITRLVGDLLATQSTQNNADLESMAVTLPPLRPHMPDGEIAQLIVGQINQHLMNPNLMGGR